MTVSKELEEAMHRTLTRAASLVVIAGTAWLGLGCGEDNTNPPQDQTGSLRIHFQNVVGAAPLELLTEWYTNGAGNDYSVGRLRYTVSDFTLVHGGTRFESGRAHAFFQDLADTHALLIENIPVGAYGTLEFTFGLDEEDNRDPDQGGTLPRTPEWEAMRWPATWGGGYHYMQLEGFFRATSGDTLSFLTHTGRRNAQNDPVLGTDPAPIPHFLDVRLAGTTVTIEPGETTDVTLSMDLNEWYATPELYDLNGDPAGGIMMNTAKQNSLEANGSDAFALRNGAPRVRH
jgi:hypothetical protein